jgi:hypothetical protein
MNDHTAYTLTSVEDDKPIAPEAQDKAFDFLIQFDRLLRKELSLKIGILDLPSYVIEECQKLIKSQGVSSIMSMVRVQESLMPKIKDTRHKYLIVDMLRDKLADLSPSNEIVIVDNYIFPPDELTQLDKDDYLNVFRSIFTPTIRKVKSVKFVTRPRYDKNIFADFQKLLLNLNPQISVSCKTTRDFHDRFWIIDRGTGLFVGTSLNGIGKKYALVDVIRKDDVAEIVNLLEMLRVV